MDIGIVGAGASGMMAALAASEIAGNVVTLFESRARCAKKLLVTGNGRCNLTNMFISRENYHGDANFAHDIISRFDNVATLKLFRELGLITTAEPNGRVYPYSDRSNSVADVLRFALERNSVRLLTDTEIVRAEKTGGRFRLWTNGGEYICDRLIISAGSPAGGSSLGTKMGHSLLESFGHERTKLYPALTRIVAGREVTRQMKGIRADAALSLVYRGKCVQKSVGEIQFTEYGVSGPAAFELSREAARRGGSCSLVIDLLRVMEEDELIDELMRRAKRSPDLPLSELLTGVLHNRVGRTLVKLCGFSLEDACGTLDENAMSRVADVVKELTLDIEGVAPMADAQVCAGGIKTSGFDPDTLESKLVPGLYASGEVLDVDGDCGGYNLQWAWSSGRIAGLSAGGAKC